MAKKKEFSVEDRLRALYDLQLIDSRIDKIKSVRGELPLEVEDLEDEVAGLEVRISKIHEELDQCSEDIKSKQNTIEYAKTMIKKYNDQQKNVRNNRAFESLSKEIEFQELEIELCTKQIKELNATIEFKKENIDQNTEKLNERQEHLNHKKNELGDILKETEKEENELLKKSKEFESKIDESLIISYKKIRSSVRNGLAVVAVERGASAGSFFTIPPQVQLDIASRKKLITDEHSGRILVDKVLADEESEKMDKLFTSI
jgi:predicted  nucleic acid-binding Zn-ribbon protein|tara:strand:- start:704 stop:1483 length:780 start_codon:yes stop_codon:yes gene_type:complete